jgi:hypothetical protein
MPDRFIDPVVAEIHAIRAALLEAAGGDISVLIRQVADRQEHSRRRVVREPLRNRAEQSVPLERRNGACSDGESTHAT